MECTSSCSLFSKLHVPAVCLITWWALFFLLRSILTCKQGVSNNFQMVRNKSLNSTLYTNTYFKQNWPWIPQSWINWQATPSLLSWRQEGGSAAFLHWSSTYRNKISSNLPYNSYISLSEYTRSAASCFHPPELQTSPTKCTNESNGKGTISDSR